MGWRMIAGIFFYLFALVLIASAVMVVTARQPVTAVLFLILCFFNAAGLFLLIGAEFLAFIMLIVYVGAVAVLFLFVVMMLDMRGEAPSAGLRAHLPVGLGVGGALLAELVAAAWSWPATKLVQAGAQADKVENTRALGRVLYTHFAYPFEVSGIILLVAMIGAITLTLRAGRVKKRQKMWAQLDCRREDVIEIRKVKSGEGAL